jgi:hypothetical protein
MGKPRIEVVYIAGANYSGSTLFSFILNTHPDILSIGEISPAPDFETEGYRCSCGEKLISCPFFLRVKDVLAKRGDNLNLSRMNLRFNYSRNSLIERLVMLRLGSRGLENLRDFLRPIFPGYKRRMREISHNMNSFLRAALDVSGKRIFVDATKSWIYIPFLKRMENVDLKVIHLIRDPRGYCNSNRRHNGISIARAARKWLADASGVEQNICNLPPNQFLRIRYEDLCSYTEVTLNKVADFLALEHFVLPKNLGAVPHHIIGNEMRSSAKRRSTIVLDEKWRKDLSKENIHTIAKKLGPKARSYGYDI